ncbi:MAG TPA: AbrB/MazE/SpoVT family DNA-binding domain-containing protein [Thermoanaerobaculia bacterium]|jgi:antitoxin MazE|nr:AbrB/MazE/SpoVT family DNA-binding domain-containing protein [Thermoanaerobaculia bacterium]
MRAKVQKWGNSLAIRVPRPFAEELGLRQDSDVDLLLEQNELVVKPVSLPRFALDDLLAEVTDENRHHEVESYGPVGDEAW